MLAPIATQHAIVQGHRIACGPAGPATGTPVIFVHGTPSSSLIWRNIIPHAERAGFRAVFFDLLGFGVSERPWSSDVDTSMTGQVAILAGLIQHLQLSSAHIVAHDIGGGIAQRFCILRPSSIQIFSLTLVNSVSFDSFPSARIKEELAAGPEKLAKAPDSEHRDFFRQWLRSTVVAPDMVEQRDDAFATYLAYISGAIGQPSFVEHQMRRYKSSDTSEVAPRYHELGVMPVKLIWGQEDGWQTVEWARKLESAIPGATLEVIRNAGHFAMEDAPDRIGKRLADFLEHTRA